VRIESGGILSFGNNSRMRVTNLVILPGGTLQIGSDTNPATGVEIIFNDVPLSDAGQYSNGLLVFGTIKVRGVPKTPFVRLASGLKAGGVLSALPPDWLPTDKLLVPDSRQDDGSGGASWTETVTAGKPLAFDHPACYEPNADWTADGTLRFAPHVANLTRSVVIRSENPSGTRGHVFFTCDATVDIQGATFGGLGRTKAEPFSATNLKGRYAVHFHHLTTSGRFVGNVITCSLDPMPYRWGATVHDCAPFTFTDNVLHNWAGAGVMLGEQWTPDIHTCTKNFFSRIRGTNGGPGDRGTEDVGVEGAGIWSMGFHHVITGNVAADCLIGFDLVCGGPDAAHVEPINLFADNEAYGRECYTGMYIWTLGMGADRWNPVAQAESVVSRYTAWHIAAKVFYGYESHHLTFDSPVWLGDWRQLKQGHGAAGYFAGDYIAYQLTFQNPEIKFLGCGINPGSIGDTTILGGSIQCTLGVYLYPSWWLNAAEQLTMTRTTTITGTTFPAIPLNLSGQFGFQGGVVLDGRDNHTNCNLVKPDLVTLDGQRVYYPEAARDAVLPQSILYDPTRPELGHTVYACPEAGLTNAQAFAKYGVCFGGAMPPVGTVPLAGSIALIAPAPGEVK
jgi:hypothetical protein